MTQLPHDVAALVELAAAHVDGPQPLFEGHLESVASLYQVHPARVERARTALTSPNARRLASALVESAPRCEARAPLSRPIHKDAAGLVTEAMASPRIMELVLRAPMELAAIQLGAHPFIVEEARLHLHAGVRAS